MQKMLGISQGTLAVTGCRGTEKEPGNTLRWKAGAQIVPRHPAAGQPRGAAGKVRSPASGWSRDRDRPEDGTGSAERNPRRRQRAARHRSPEASGHRSPRRPSRAQAGPRAGLGGAPGGAASPSGSPVQAFLKRPEEPSREKPVLLPAREELMVYWSRRFHIPQG